jgi:hypothetical protein
MSDRREFLKQGLATAATALLVSGSAGSTTPMTTRYARKKLFEPDDHFLSPYNPLWTVDQRDVERKAIELFQHPTIVKARKIIAQRWRALVGPELTAEAEQRFDELIQEFAFCYLLEAVNGDPNYPKVTAGVYGPPHEWMGLKVPGSRASGGDGPDQTYSFIPIDFGARYEIYGQRFEPVVADCPYMLAGDTSFNMTLAMLQSYDMEFESDGRFVITIDPSPANGRRNHIQTQPNARFIFIRECRNDWRQLPAKHRIRRLDPPTAPKWTDEQITTKALHDMAEGVPRIYWFIKLFRNLQVNTITAPFHTGDVFGMVSQAISFGRLSLKDDEAFVITIGHGGAGFRDIVLHDSWFRTPQYWKHTSSMCPAQSIPNPDGKSTTYVVSLQDPGVHNWLDPAGLHDTLLVNRWQALPKNASPEDRPFATGQLVKLNKLDDALPRGMKRVSAEERRAQLAERLATFNLRYDG